MANYKGHLLGGCVAYGVLLYVICIIEQQVPAFVITFEWLICTLAGSLFPDIDIKSKGQKYFYWVVLGILCCTLYQSRSDVFAVVSIGALFPMLVRHRGIFHNFWFLVALTVGMWWLLSLQFPLLTERLLFDSLFFLVGIFSHLWLDRGFFKLLRN